MTPGATDAAAILADPSPDAALRAALERLDAARDDAGQVALFEQLAWRHDIADYWVWFRMCRTYIALGRPDAAVLCAARAVRIEPDWPASEYLHRVLFDRFRARDDLAACGAVLAEHTRRLPDSRAFAPDESAPVFRALGIDPASLRPAPAQTAAVARLQEVMRTVFARPDLTVTSDTTLEDVAGWDSVSQVSLMLGAEDALGTRFEPEAFLAARSVGALASLMAGVVVPVAEKPKLIVYGNCHAGALAAIYARTPAIADRYYVVHHDLWPGEDTRARDLADFATAEVLMIQDVSQWRAHPLAERLPAGLRVAWFPFYHVSALWPFDAAMTGADPGMERAMQAAERAGVWLPFRYRDVLLGRLRDELPDPQARFARYRDTVPPDLARRAEIEEARLLAEDARHGLTTGRYIVDNYRRTRLFHTLTHPTIAVMHRVAAEVLGRAGIDLGGAPLAEVPEYMGDLQVPVHPGVIERLGLTWVDADSRYSMDKREHWTWAEYVRRYIETPVPA